jgi:Rieske 2Fe-2S family protein
MRKKLSRRDFARTSVAVGVAVGLPGALVGQESDSRTRSAAAGAAAAKWRRVMFPPEVAYGGLNSEGRHTTLDAVLTPAGQPVPTYPGGWKEGTTIPAEYYIDEKHYLNDERFLKEHFWFLADHEKRIPKPGDYFLYQFGRGESVIILRDRDGAVKGYHNVCRHRGSRLCLHDEDLPSESGPGGKRPDSTFSVVQLGAEGNTQVFRCPYHAWTYDLNGRLIYVPPNGTPSGFDQAQYGLHPAHVRTVEGFIYVSFAQNPPDFETWLGPVRELCEGCGTALLKIAARRSVPTKANWKLVIENFRECYHCQPSHANSYIRAYWQGDETLTAAQIARIEEDIRRHGHEPTDYWESIRYRATGSGPSMAGTASAQSYGMQHWRPGYVTASLDGKPVGPLLPGLKERSHYQGAAASSYRRRSGSSGFSTSGMFVLDDYAFSYRFTPRDVRHTDVEMVFLVHPDAVEGKDYDVEHMVGLWHNTLREDRWVAENNHTGLFNSRYAFTGGQPYMFTEGGPAAFVKWYMTEVAPRA